MPNMSYQSLVAQAAREQETCWSQAITPRLSGWAHNTLSVFRKTWYSSPDLVIDRKIRYLTDTCMHDRAYVCIQMWTCPRLCVHIREQMIARMCTHSCRHDRPMCVYTRQMITRMCTYSCRNDWACVRIREQMIARMCTYSCRHDCAHVCIYVSKWLRACVHILAGMFTPMCAYTCRHNWAYLCIYACRHDCAYLARGLVGVKIY